ncbi:MAG: Chromatin structure-remodeling complex protein rsc9 [Cirrosporium novae-zelandiae]|nr:MAG: Chromatin structure-remodeling complex protein rsc9 [Cirrosporium novae-zelandiae]
MELDDGLTDDQFLADLAEYHTNRGTTLDREPRVANRPVNLHKLYLNINLKHGGYDEVSHKRLGWRELSKEFRLGDNATSAFSLKTVYYRNLAAYEIQKFRHKTPPPPQILEEISAKGGDLLNRTIKSFKPPDKTKLINGTSSQEIMERGQNSPADKMDVDENGLTRRNLRQNPTPARHYQPDTSSTRQTRQSSGHAQSPQPTPTYNNVGSYSPNPSANPNSMSFQAANYEPRPEAPLTMRPVITPGYNPSLYEEKRRDRKRLLSDSASLTGSYPTYDSGVMLPGTGFPGPNIYVRCLRSLQSVIPTEQDFALHHLVKVSFERGDKFKFDAFPGLAEALIRKVLDISSLYFDVEWEISYEDDGAAMMVTKILDGVNGTPNILDKIKFLELKPLQDVEWQDEDFQLQLTLCVEAALVLRNMVCLEENAKFVAGMPILQDLLCITLNLPKNGVLDELQNYSLEIAEEVTRHWCLEADSPLYTSLLSQLYSDDRGVILCSLRAISRISMYREEMHYLRGVPDVALQSAIGWLLLEDDDLKQAALDFLYQFTLVDKNVDSMLGKRAINLAGLCRDLARHCFFGAVETEEKEMIKPETKAPAPTVIPDTPRDRLAEIIRKPEPERSSQWLKTCFKEDPDSDITQIELWKAYQARFSIYNPALNLPAADFIKNVSNTFNGANAQVISEPVQKFIIKGIRPRHYPVDEHGKKYLRCLWQTEHGECGDYIKDARGMIDHIMEVHLGQRRQLDGTFENSLSSSPLICEWNHCQKFAAQNGTTHLKDFRAHILVHMPYPEDTPNITPGHFAQNRPHSPDIVQEAEYRTIKLQNTLVDEHGDPCGIAYTSTLVLRNIGKALLRKDGEGRFEWTLKVLGPIKDVLLNSLTYNRVLAANVSDVIMMIQRASAHLNGGPAEDVAGVTDSRISESV